MHHSETRQQLSVQVFQGLTGGGCRLMPGGEPIGQVFTYLIDMAMCAVVHIEKIFGITDRSASSALEPSSALERLHPKRVVWQALLG